MYNDFGALGEILEYNKKPQFVHNKENTNKENTNKENTNKENTNKNVNFSIKNPKRWWKCRNYEEFDDKNSDEYILCLAWGFCDSIKEESKIFRKKLNKENKKICTNYDKYFYDIIKLYNIHNIPLNDLIKKIRKNYELLTCVNKITNKKITNEICKHMKNSNENLQMLKQIKNNLLLIKLSLGETLGINTIPWVKFQKEAAKQINYIDFPKHCYIIERYLITLITKDETNTTQIKTFLNFINSKIEENDKMIKKISEGTQTKKNKIDSVSLLIKTLIIPIFKCIIKNTYTKECIENQIK
jgi:hypothetical protein